jgi:alpha,alpha-trehalose phosphorylase
MLLFDRDRDDAALFDLDGVLTSTAALHARCWKRVFEEVLAERARLEGTDPEPFGVESDYLGHVDGKARADGVRDFVRARGIDVPEGRADSPPDEWSAHGIAGRKQALVEPAPASEPIDTFPGAVRLVHGLREAGVLTAVVPSSSNCDDLLRAARIADLFELTIDGNDVARAGLRGKPAPDGFLEGARRLAVSPERAVVVEDAIAGLATGRAGGFGLVVGVAHNGAREQLPSAGADMVVDDLGELAP